MESKESEKGDIERLAEMRAKRRMESWSERFNSWLQDLRWILVYAGLGSFLGFTLSAPFGSTPESRLFGSSPEIFVSLIIITVVLLIWFQVHSKKAWKQKRLHQFYEEELLELRVRSERESKRGEASLT